nr:uncharacterized protein LOC117992592 [Maniola hyperantus]
MAMSLLIPYPTVQHFIWPLHWCLLADICNHTWIPECGTENDEDIHSRRLFIDECDMFEYNCDYVKDYYVINYSDCFNIPTTPCPPRLPCPTCPKGLRLGEGHIPHRRMPVKPTTLGVSLPERMLNGKRRYSPAWRKKTWRTTRPIKREPTTTKIVRTMVVKTETVLKNGKMMMKVVKGFIVKRKGQKTTEKSDDFLE